MATEQVESYRQYKSTPDFSGLLSELEVLFFMQARKGIIFPRIAEEVVDYAELLSLWGCSYQTAYRILHGFAPPNHRRKEQLSEYLGIPINELWAKDESVEVRVYRGVPEEDAGASVGEILEG